MSISENGVIFEVDIGKKLSGKDIDIIAEIIHGVLIDEGIDKDLDGFTFDLIAYYAKDDASAADDDEYYEDYDHGREMQDEPHQFETDHSVRSYIYGDGKQQ